MDELVTYLMSCSVWNPLDREALELLACAAELRNLRPGEVLFTEDEPKDATYILVKGSLELTRFFQSGNLVLKRYDAVASMCESALVGTTQHTASATAEVDSEVLVIPGAKVRALLDEASGRVARQILEKVAQEIVDELRFASFDSTGPRSLIGASATRTEHDLLGDREVPDDALYGIQTLRGVENFPITGVPLSRYPLLVRSLAMVKQAAARSNRRLGEIDEKLALAIERACEEIIGGLWHGHFVVDMIQGGAGTSTNMNANEVIANRALELLGCARGDYNRCHPNDHVNLAQSTNDAYPTALRIATVFGADRLSEAMARLRDAFRERAEAFADVVKMGRTQLQDAVPMTLGQEFGAYATTIDEDINRLSEISRLFCEINLGGTAIGTGINAHPEYSELAVEELAAISGLQLSLASDLIEATHDTGAFVLFSGMLKRISVKLSKICNDLRLLSSGPRCGLNEIHLPAMQPGSSIMPGKVNPVIPEVLNQITFQVIGNDLAITLAAEGGQLQLNVFEPLIAHDLFMSMDMLYRGIEVLRERCVSGIEANRERCRELVDGSIGIVTALVPILGYKASSALAKEALETGRGVRELAIEKGLLDAERIDALLSPEGMLRPS